MIKTRMQLQGELERAGTPNRPRYPGIISGLKMIARSEGLSGLYSGVPAALLREMIYSGIRLGIYDPIKDLLSTPDSAENRGTGIGMPLWKKITAGAAAGMIGASIANPTDVVKIRLQAQAFTGTRAYTGTFHAFKTIWQSEGGLPGLYRGVGPTTQRAVLLTASQVPTYDHTKHFLLSHSELGFVEGRKTHLTASFIAGLVCATVTAPVDNIKSRYMNQLFDARTGKGTKYSSTLDCIWKTFSVRTAQSSTAQSALTTVCDIGVSYIGGRCSRFVQRIGS